MIGIIDSKICNIFSVINALDYLQINHIVSSDPNELMDCTSFILPGVGTFDHGMQALNKFGLVEFIHDACAKDKPFLGICLGMQLLFNGSDEGTLPGLGLIDGYVRKLPLNIVKRIPHIGWNDINFSSNQINILDGIENGSNYYFIHSFYTDFDSSFLSASTEYDGFEFKSIVNKGNIFGTQFHPEKSQSNGLKILKNFGNLSNVKS